MNRNNKLTKQDRNIKGNVFKSLIKKRSQFTTLRNKQTGFTGLVRRSSIHKIAEQ